MESKEAANSNSCLDTQTIEVYIYFEEFGQYTMMYMHKNIFSKLLHILESLYITLHAIHENIGENGWQKLIKDEKKYWWQKLKNVDHIDPLLNQCLLINIPNLIQVPQYIITPN